ncbi:MAG TPA: LacI family DNA-binding transcriptional regulator [Candidatus Dormibacteraeota bacterium]|nr:LacI family DNA-binding transcriptional regulator [Candidatus Dormibacteraeota bacterium]
MAPHRKKNFAKGAKAASIYDVARESRVSVFTVSAVVNNKSHVGNKLRERVEAAIRKLNYRPNLLARSLAKQKTHTIGMVVPDIANPFFPMVVRGAEDAAQKRGYNLLLCNSDDNQAKEESSIELLLSKRVDGILLTKATCGISPSLLQMIREMKIPIVMVMRTFPKISKDAVITDDYQGAYEAVCHLARAGRKRIALIGGPMKVSNGKARWKGFRDALKAHGLTYDPTLVIEGDYRTESGYRAGHLLLSRRPDGVYVANYLMTVGFLKAAEEIGLHCPEDFGLVSFDDYPWLGIFRPRLTTVELPKYQLGFEAGELLLDRIAGKNGPAVLRKLLPELRVRESCGFKLHGSTP